MVVIFAEKQDVGIGIAAAISPLKINGELIRFEDLDRKKKMIAAAVREDGFIQTTYNGEPCYVTWGMGHLCRLKDVEEYQKEYKKWKDVPLPFIPPKFEVVPRKGPKNDKYNTTERTKKQIAVCKKLFDQADYIINATDNDREGDLIFAYLRQYLKNKKPFKRAIFNEKTEKGFKKAFESANLEDGSTRDGITDAGKARSQADWLVGINTTMAYTLSTGNLRTLGRVQTPALNMIVEREREIANFKSEPFWVIAAKFQTDTGETYVGKGNVRYVKKEEADAALQVIQNEKRGIVANVKKKVIKKNPPTLYTQTFLQAAAAKEYGLTMEETMRASQSLYDKGFTTYPRTASNVISENEEKEYPKRIAALERMTEYASLISGREKKIIERRCFVGNPSSHSAITPTGVIPAGLSDVEKKIYDLIVRSYIRMMYPSAELEQTQIETKIREYPFYTAGNRVIKKGWMEVDGVPEDAKLPAVQKGDSVAALIIKEVEGKTKAPSRYTLASLPTAMANIGKEIDDEELSRILLSEEVKGIGTEATRASIIESLIQRKYIEVRKKQYYATEEGIALIDELPVPELKSAKMTARWEQIMSGIEKGKAPLEKFMAFVVGNVRTWCHKIKEDSHSDGFSRPKEVIGKNAGTSLGVCPKCGANKVYKTKWGYACAGANSSSCDFYIHKEILKKKIPESTVRQLCKEGETDKIEGFISARTGKSFSAKLVFDGKKVSFSFPK